MPKLAPKNVKICPGCPPKEIEPVIVPNFRLGTPVRKDEKKKVVSIVNRSDYRHGNHSSRKNTLF